MHQAEDRVRQRIEAGDLPLLAADWLEVHIGIALGRLARRSRSLQPNRTRTDDHVLIRSVTK